MLQKMNKHKCKHKILITAIVLVFSACANHSAENVPSEKTVDDGFTVTDKMPDTTHLHKGKKDALKKIYSVAIAEFIKAAFKNDKTIFDTLYFGKHAFGQPDDFPDIELPDVIEKTHIRLVTPEAGQKKQSENRSLVYVNMMGWVDVEKAEFIFVVFSNGAEHQYDYHVNFAYNAASREYEVEKIEFENYLRIGGQKPKRITIYENGNYTVSR